MQCCKSPQCIGIENVFDNGYASDDLKRYYKKGPSKQTQMLIDQAAQLDLSGGTLLDIGGGIGIIQHELAGQGLEKIISVDASAAFSQVCREEASRRGYASRAEHHVGNFVDLAAQLPPADIVTLDRVICCFDDMPALVQSSASKARRLYGLVFPVDSWYAKLARGAFNFYQAVLRKPFRLFTHSSRQVEELVLQAGFKPVQIRRGWIWQVRIYEKI